MNDDTHIATPFITTMQKIPMLTINPLNLHLPDQPEICLKQDKEKIIEKVNLNEEYTNFEELKNEINQTNNKKKWLEIIKFVEVPDKVVPPRALAVLPLNLQYKSGVISPHLTLNVYSKLGPVQGISRQITQLKAQEIVCNSVKDMKPIYLFKNRTDETTTHIDVSDYDKSNWIAYLNLGTKDNANVWLHQFDQHLYLVTVEAIPARRPLLVGYSKEYAELHGIPDSQPILDLADRYQNISQFKCTDCCISMKSIEELERHNRLHVKPDPKLKRNNLCGYCSKGFSRMYCLKRHIENCPKKTSNENIPESSKNTLKDKQVDLSMDVEDRQPSDESFQNFTNILDFSTNLFDTERIPSLDISGSSKSNDDSTWRCDSEEHESFGQMIGGSSRNKQSLKKIPPKKMSSPYLCSFCKQHIPRTKFRYHSRTCPARRFECQCGRVFRSKEKLAIHAFTIHRIKDSPSQKLKQKRLHTPVPYKCTDCNQEFKRRGMLVNHLTRLHETPSIESVPLVVQDIRFPCPVCPKLYKTRAKRDLHVKTHHPGTKCTRSHVIVGGLKTKQPSVCVVCPKEYASRAKMLQHVRRHHPEYPLEDRDSPTQIIPTSS